MTDATAEQLTAAYGSFRQRMTTLGRSLDSAAANAMTPTCPDWSAKDVLAHMTGIAADILDGNVEGAATEAWADAQVERRRGASLADVLDEWEARGPDLEALLAKVGPDIAFQFYLDAWTHEWDLRQAIGAAPEAPDYSLIGHTMSSLSEALNDRLSSRALTPVDVVLLGLPSGPFHMTFDGAAEERQQRSRASIELSVFEFLRIAMGRRSRKQIEAALGTARLAEGDWVDAFVFWSVNEADIVDPAIL